MHDGQVRATLVSRPHHWTCMRHAEKQGYAYFWIQSCDLCSDYFALVDRSYAQIWKEKQGPGSSRTTRGFRSTIREIVRGLWLESIMAISKPGWGCNGC